MTEVHFVQCCFGANIKKTIGPYADYSTAAHIANAVEEHFYNGGNQYTQIETREVIEP
jgi:hypothetical protein